MKKPILHTERLFLRWVEHTDTDFVIQLLNDPLFIQNIGDRKVRNTEDAKKYIEKIYREQYDQLGYGLFLVELKDSKKLIGVCSLVARDWTGETDIGFALLDAYSGHGYATEASKVVLNYARVDLKFKRIIGMTLTTNITSQKVLEKIGMQFEKNIIFPDDGQEGLLYSLDL